MNIASDESDEVLFEKQRGKCPGCRKDLTSLTIGSSQNKKTSNLWTHATSTLSNQQEQKNPRKCEYTNALYCDECHENELAMIPARVLHQWDFTLRPVCSASMAYLTSIYPLPVLCISAVNPGLYARQPILAQIHKKRQEIVNILDVIKSNDLENGYKIISSFMNECGMLNNSFFIFKMY